MKRSKITKISALFLVLVLFLAVTFVPNAVNADNYEIQAGVELSRTATPNELNLDEENPENNHITVDYEVTFEPVDAADVATQTSGKEVVLILDTSGSMAWSLSGDDDDDSELSRMTLVKQAAKSFVNKLAESEGVKVALVEYDTRAYVYEYGNEQLADLSIYKSDIKRKISSFSAEGGTNIGDAIRRAHYILEGGNPDADKYVILLTDGVPTAMSLSEAKVKSTNSNNKSIGKYYFNNGNSSKTVADVHSTKYFTEDGNPPKYYVNWGGTGDYNNHARIYAYQMASLFKGTDITSHYIAFGDAQAANKLPLFAKKAGGTFHESYSEQSINAIYDSIADEIINEVSIEELRFEETLPPGMTFVSSEDGVVSDGQFISKSFDPVIFKLDSSKNQYIAEPIQFSVVLAPEAVGEYVLGDELTSSLHYKDFDGNYKHHFYSEEKIIVGEPVDPDLTANTHLNVLEVQPGFNFELRKSDLLKALEGYTVSLTQMSMSQFVGTIEEVNGKYDIVYFGATDTFDDFTMTGASGNSIKVDVDITNRRASHVLEYINAGQVMVFDNEIFGLSNSKLVSNFNSIRGLSNVQEVSSASNTEFYEKLNAWYDNANHRPRLTLNSNPIAYDGTRASYSDNHSMGYLFSAFSELDSNMQAILSVDINGDGVFTADEQMTDKTVSDNRIDIALNYSLDNSFNGLMPWKFELVDTVTNTKDYVKGFTAYSGIKTVVNVLQLSPGTNRLNVDSSGFKLPLETEDYEINVTFMQISDFNKNYPDEVNGVPTLLNGNYDMIIFGFGDSYAGKSDGYHSNKDLTSESAIKAIDDFIQTGQSILYTHDTAGPQDWINNTDMRTSSQSYNQYVNYNDAPNITANFKDDMGFSNTRTYAGKRMWRAWNATDAYKLNDGLITMYPYVLAENANNTLDIASTHDQYWEIDLEQPEVVPWFTLDLGNFKYYPAAYYYTFTNGNITYSGSGHSSPNGVEEQEFFVNTMLKASRGANHAPTLDVVDIYDGMNIPPTEETIEFKLKIHDIDTQDIIFNTKVFIVLEDGTEIKVLEKGDMEKEVLTDLSFNKPIALDDDEQAFIIKIVVEDVGGAKGMEEIEITHIEVPTLEVTADVTGYLVGDAFDIVYDVSTVDPANEQFVSDIELSSTIDSAYIVIDDYTDWNKSNKLYSIAPVFDNPDTAVDEGNTSFALGMTARLEGTFDMILSGTYDVHFSDGGDSLIDEVYERVTPIDVKSGQIKVEVLDNLDRSVEGATVTVSNNGNIVATGLTTETGVYDFENIKSGTYTVSVTVPEGFIAPEQPSQEVVLEYGDGQSDNYIKEITFAAKDNHAPIITTQYEDGIVVLSELELEEGEAFTTPIHVMVDGNNSRVEEVSYMPLPEGVEEMTPEEYIALGGGTTLVADPESPFTLDPNKLAGVEVLRMFEVSGNGKFVIFARNAAGNMSVQIIEMKNIIPELPDNI